MLLADPVPVRSWRAELDLRYERRDARTVLAARRHDGPLVVQKPLYPEGDAVCHTLLIHPPGGIAGGDALHVRGDLGAGTHVLLTTPAAGKWYRSAGPWARQRVEIAADDACVEWLPQESILYDGARACIETDVSLTAASRFIGWEIVCLGRAGSAERFRSGVCRLHTRVARDDKLVWLERGTIDAAGLFASSQAGLGGHTVFGTMIAAGEVNRAVLDECRALKADEGMTGVTSPPGLLIARYIGDCGEVARAYFQRLWRAMRPALAGREAHMPRIWST